MKKVSGNLKKDKGAASRGRGSLMGNGFRLGYLKIPQRSLMEPGDPFLDSAGNGGKACLLLGSIDGATLRGQ